MSVNLRKRKKTDETSYYIESRDIHEAAFESLFIFEDIIEGECEIGYKTIDFIPALIEGSDIRRHSSEGNKVEVKSVCFDRIDMIVKG